MRDIEVLNEIERYTQTHGEMPTKICGTFMQLLPICGLKNYIRFMDKDVYLAPPCYLEVKLDINAGRWYVA